MSWIIRIRRKSLLLQVLIDLKIIGTKTKSNRDGLTVYYLEAVR